MSLLTAISNMFASQWRPMSIDSPPPIEASQGRVKPQQRQAKRRRARQRAKRLKHY